MNNGNWITNNFDIDLWIKLAKDHPLKFEQQREQWIDHAIIEAKQEHKQRLQGLKWEINMDLAIAKNKFNPCKSIASRLVNHLQEMKDILTGDHQPFFYARPARVIDFSTRETNA